MTSRPSQCSLLSKMFKYFYTGLISSEEMIRSASTICNSLQSIPCIGDGDTGYGNAMNVKRTVAKYSQAGLAGIMIEDQVKLEMALTLFH